MDKIGSHLFTIQLLLLVLKAAGVLNLSWAIVFGPLYIFLAFVALIFIVAILTNA